MLDQPPPSRLSIVEKGGRLVVIDRETGTVPLTAAQRMKLWDERNGSARPKTRPSATSSAPQSNAAKPMAPLSSASLVQEKAKAGPPAKPQAQAQAHKNQHWKAAQNKGPSASPFASLQKGQLEKTSSAISASSFGSLAKSLALYAVLILILYASAPIAIIWPLLWVMLFTLIRGWPQRLFTALDKPR